jgi:hypothetical protein
VSWRTIETPAVFEHAAAGRLIVQQGIPRADTLTFTIDGTPWKTPFWLYDALVYRTEALGGWALVSLLHLGLTVFAFGFWTRKATQVASTHAAGFAGILMITAVLLHLPGPGPSRLSWLWMSLLWATLHHPFSRPWMRWVWASAIQLLWVNSAPYAVAGPVFAAAFTGEAVLRLDPAVRKSRSFFHNLPPHTLWLAAALAGVCALTPYGFGSALLSFSGGDTATFILPSIWSTPGAHGVSSPLVYFAIFSFVACILARREQLPLLPLTAGAVACFILLSHKYDLASFGLFSIPFFAVSLDALADAVCSFSIRYLRYPLRTSPRVASMVFPVFALAVLGVGMSGRVWQQAGFFSHRGLGLTPHLFPVDAAKRLARPDAPRRVLNHPIDGGTMAWYAPGHRVAVDTRTSMYPPEFQSMVDHAFGGDAEKLDALSRRWHADGILFRCALQPSLAPLETLLRGKEWVLAWFDGTSALLVRSDTVAPSFRPDPQLQRAAMQILEERRDEARGSRRARGPAGDLLGAGLFFLNTGHLSLAMDYLNLAQRHAPQFRPLALLRAKMLIRMGRPAESCAILEQITGTGIREEDVWPLLVKAYTMAGQPEQAAKAESRLKRLQESRRSP